MADYPAEGSANWAAPLKEYIDETAATGGGELNANNITSGTLAEERIDTAIARDSEVAAEAALARNADNLTSGTVADARIPSTIARDAETTAAVAAEALLARDASNLTSGTVADARIAATIARDSEVAAEAVLARNADNLTSGTVADARIAATIARDSELAAEAVLARNADNLTSGTVADARIPSTIARDSETTAAVAAEAVLARNADNLSSGTVADARIAATIARDSEVTAITDLKSDKVRVLNSQTGTSYALVVADADKTIDISNSGTHTLTVPTHASQAIPQGSVIPVYRRGTGDVIVAPVDGTVTINAPGGNLGLPLRYDVGYLWKWGTNTWVWIVNPDLAGYASDADLSGAIAGLAAVASSGDYDDLSNTPTLPISRSDVVASPQTLTVVTPTDLTLLNALDVGTYDIECLISFTGDSTDDSKFRLLFSGTATCMLKIVASRTAWAGSSATGMSIEEGAQKLGVQTTFDTTVTAIGSAANPGIIHWCGRVYVTVAGNLTVNGGKSADANATDTVVAAGSYLTAVEVLTTP